jgi:hypothetical protein
MTPEKFQSLFVNDHVEGIHISKDSILLKISEWNPLKKSINF